MTAFAGWLDVGGAIVDGVLTEPPGLARQPVDATVVGATTTFAVGVTFGPFVAAAGPFAAFALFDAADAGTMRYIGATPALNVVVGEYLSFPKGDYTMAAAPSPGVDVVTIGGVPLRAGGQPVRVE